ncbi:unnamed protein product [Nyctereutes procyonoides]|uniref:(raccoon dog) hypothetical protein n=1 Tax=Nyctereutes procyonoides TaxID=34880 RepID=A0A811ZG43_NYCPR|nr:unnamed protein product [Nyctereutes procyonoides]
MSSFHNRFHYFSLGTPKINITSRSKNKKINLPQRQADEVTEIMLNNFDKVLERDGKLAELELPFSKTTKNLAQKRWENVRCRIYLGLVVGIGLLIILTVLLVIFLPWSSGDSSAPHAQDAGAASGPGG